jgi:hypothetical protein
MRRSRPLAASLIGLGLGVAGCDTVSTTSTLRPGPQSAVPVLPHDAAVVVIGLSLAVLAFIVASIFWRGIAHDRLAGRLGRASHPAVIDERPVSLVPGPRIALVAGLRRPRTFVSDDVVRSLSHAELAAVLAHEWHHELHRAPLALVVLSGVGSALGWLPPVGRCVDRLRAQIEIDADGHALTHGSSRQAIALAIVKLNSPPGSRGLAGFGSAVDVRLQALLDDQGQPPARTVRDDIALAIGLAAVGVVICSALSL